MKRQHSDRARLQHVRDAIQLIFTFLEEDPERGVRTREAIIRQLEIIGEACNRVSGDLQFGHPEIPWRDIIAMRNLLAHGYMQIEVKEVWDTVDNDLQPLLDSVLVLLDNPDIM